MLSHGINVAKSSLTSTAEQIALVSRNVARAKDPDAVKKEARVITAPGGGVSVVGVRRTANAALIDALFNAKAQAGFSSAIASGLDRLNDAVSELDSERAPAAAIGKLRAAMHFYANEPQSHAAGRAAMAAASDVVAVLRAASAATNGVRVDADAQIAQAVDNINSRLSRFEEVNRAIVNASSSGRDVTDYEDERESLLKQIAEEVGIRTVIRGNGDMVIYTDSGIPLFETTTRRVSFTRTPGLPPGVSGNAVYIDGIAAAGVGQTMAIESGRIRGLVTLRDDLTAVYQAQLDEIARGLVVAFAEYDQTGGSSPPYAGIFTDAGAATVPAVASVVNGLAGRISISPQADPDVGGIFTYLRDGGLGGAAYVYNATGASGYATRLNQLIDSLDVERVFDPVAQVVSDADLASFAAGSAAWLQGERQIAAQQQSFAVALEGRSVDALANETGINLDEEMIEMLALERSYQASSRLISVIDKMFETLIATAG